MVARNDRQDKIVRRATTILLSHTANMSGRMGNKARRFIENVTYDFFWFLVNDGSHAVNIDS